MPALSLPVAFDAGVLGFFSPCILPLIPGYLSFVAGVSLAELEGSGGARLRVLGATAVFVLGFSTIFTALGASASLAGGFVLSNRELLSRAGGAIVILFGLVVLGVVSVPGLARERRILITRRPTGWLGVLLVGMAFGFAWTPCVGPILGAILTLAATAARADRGAVLLFVYSLGLGLPFLAAAACLSGVARAFLAARRYVRSVEVAGGLLLVVLGTALLFDWVYRLNSWFMQIVPLRPIL